MPPIAGRSKGSGRQVHRAAGENLSATDEALFATSDYLKNNAADADILVEELINTSREITKSRSRGRVPQQIQVAAGSGRRSDAEITAYYKELSKHRFAAQWRRRGKPLSTISPSSHSPADRR
jgi:hypothetical protein